MGFIDTLMSNPGYLLVGAMAGLYMIGDRLFKDRTERKRDAQHDESKLTLMESWEKSLTTANKLVEDERKRAQELSSENAKFAADNGKLEAERNYEKERRQETEGENEHLRSMVERLALEVKSKDRSIEELVSLNRDLLKLVTNNPGNGH